MNDHVLLNISTVTGKWFRKFVFNFNLTGVYAQFVELLCIYNVLMPRLYKNELNTNQGEV